MKRRRSPPQASQAAPDPSDVNAMFVSARDGSDRPEYLWSVLMAARSAKDLGLGRVTVAELGVAGGNGLLALEAAAAVAERLLGVGVDVAGFDTGTGMPPPADHRDIPFLIRPGYFAMDEPALRGRLERAELVLGPVDQTVARWLSRAGAPVGFLAFDLDYWSSTAAALAFLEAPDDRLLPRVVCYFDDVLGVAWSDFNGARAAIAAFNDAHAQRKVAVMHGLRFTLPPSEFTAAWPEKMFLAHLFDHGRYNEPVEVADVWLEGTRLRPDP